MGVPGCAVGTGAVPWSRVAGDASARLDGVGRDAALSWKLTAVMEQTTTEVTFEHHLSFSIFFYSFLFVVLADFPFRPITSPPVSPVNNKKKIPSLYLLFIPLCRPSPAETPVESRLVIIILNMYLCVRMSVCECLFFVLSQLNV